MDSLKQNRLIVASVALAVLIGLWAWLRQRQEIADASGPSREDLSGYLPRLEREAIVEISVKRPGDEPAVVLRRTDDTWNVTAPVTGPADKSNVDAAVDRLVDLAVQRVVSENRENQARLKVDDAGGIQVVVRNEAGAALLSLVIGEHSAGRTMVRKQGEDRVVAVGDSIRYVFDRDLSRWRSRTVTDVDHASVVAARFFPRSGEAFRFQRNGENEWEQSPGDKPLPDFDPLKVQGIVSSLSKITATDFGAADLTAEAAGFVDGIARVELDVRAAPEESEADAPTAAESSQTPEGGPGTEGAAAAGPGPEDTVTSVETIVLRATSTGPEEGQHYLQRDGDPAIFVVSSYHGDRVIVKTDSFQKDPPPPVPAPPTAPAPGT